MAANHLIGVAVTAILTVKTSSAAAAAAKLLQSCPTVRDPMN